LLVLLTQLVVLPVRLVQLVVPELRYGDDCALANPEPSCFRVQPIAGLAT
jgi:hypothetical protein